MEQRLLRGCSGAVALRAVCPAQITAGAAQNAVGPQVAEKPVGAVGRDLGHRAQQSRVAAGGRRVLGGARRLEVLDLNKDTVPRYAWLRHERESTKYGWIYIKQTQNDNLTSDPPSALLRAGS